MTTLVGTQKDFANALKALLELDYDAAAAYQAAIERLKNVEFKAQLSSFKADHERHIEMLSDLLREKGHIPPNGPDLKEILTKGKVYLANLFGDKAIIAAMITNEDDTNTAYERINQHAEKWPESLAILQAGWEDEIHHRKWLLENKERLA